MDNGKVVYERSGREEYMFGEYESFCVMPSKEDIYAARRRIVQNLCNEVKRLARECPEEFFVEKEVTGLSFMTPAVYTVGAKLIAPTVRNKYERRNESGKC